VQIVIDAFYLYAFFDHSRETLVKNCLDGSTDSEVEKICNSSFDTGKYTVLISVVVGLIIQICEFVSLFVICCENLNGDT
jgi:hypothetical protein